MHGHSTPVFIYLRGRLIRFSEQILSFFIFNEGVAPPSSSSVKKELIKSEIFQRNYFEKPSCDQDLTLVIDAAVDMSHDFKISAKNAESNGDGTDGTSFNAQCTCFCSQLSFDDWIKLESEDSWPCETTCAEMCSGSGAHASSGKTPVISVNEIIQGATEQHALNAHFAWCECPTNAQANELVTQAVNASIEEWCSEYGSDPGAVPESTRILAHAFVLASFWINRESVALIADVMRHA